jgi:hypothetical protein
MNPPDAGGSRVLLCVPRGALHPGHLAPLETIDPHCSHRPPTTAWRADSRLFLHKGGDQAAGPSSPLMAPGG